MTAYERKVYYYETDKMGIVHHSNYIKWLEEARIDFLSQIGLPYDDVERNGVVIPVLGVSVQYRKAFRFGDSFQIDSSLEEFTGVKIKMTYDIKKADTGEIHAIGESRHAFVNDEMKPVRLKKDFPAIYERLSRYMQENINNR